LVVKSAVPNTDDEIEVIAEKSGPWGRIRIRESQGISGINKCSIFLTPDQLEEHARVCLALAAEIRRRQTDQAASSLPAGSAKATEAERAHYLGMTIEQYRKTFSKGSL